MSGAGADLQSRFETTDGSRPDATPLAAADADALPLAAFSVLRTGDAFERETQPPDDGLARARAVVEARVKIKRHFAPRALAEQVRADMAVQLSANVPLIERVARCKPIVVDLIPKKKALGRYGYPDNVVPNAAGLFWDHPSWSQARIALRVDSLETEETLVTHEWAHAIHYLAFTKEERDLIYKVLRPSFGSRAAMDEVFAIYSEREFCADFTETERRAPGVYGITRRQWDEDHLFTRFVRKLYFPHRRLAGREAKERAGARAWKAFSS
jgi:hypothetical protein